MGYIRGAVHGFIIGTAVGLCIAPQDGTKTRDQLRVAGTRVRDGVGSAQETARRVAPQVREAAETATGMVAAIRDKVKHRENGAADGVEMAGSPAPAMSGAGGLPGIPV